MICDCAPAQSSDKLLLNQANSTNHAATVGADLKVENFLCEKYMLL